VITAHTVSHGLFLASLGNAHFGLCSASGFLLACFCCFLFLVIMTVIMFTFLRATTFLGRGCMLQASIPLLSSIVTAVFTAPLGVSSTHARLLGNVITLLVGTDFAILSFGLLGTVFDTNPSIPGLIGAIRYVAFGTTSLPGGVIFSR
jgi:hypothetical protein